jgi:formylmethanofuran dehydrogenase subunit B
VIVIDTERTATAERADLFVAAPRESWFETLWTLRALVLGVTVEPERATRATGVPLETLSDLAGRLKQARYGAFFMGATLGAAPGGPATVEAALRLVRDLNSTRRFVILGLGGAGNVAGAESALTWQTGYPAGVNLARGWPRSLPGATSPIRMLESGEADAALIVADSFVDELSHDARARLAKIPTIVIAPKTTGPEQTATVALDAATFGIDAGGTVTRSDGVVLPLRPPLTAAVPTDRELLREIERRLKTPDVEAHAPWRG